MRQTLRGLVMGCCALLVVLMGLEVGSAHGPAGSLGAQEIVFRPPDSAYSVSCSATGGNSWNEGGFQVVQLNGPVEIRQGDLLARAREAILLIDSVSGGATAERKVIVYLEGEVQVELPVGPVVSPATENTPLTSQRLEDERWLGRLFTANEIQFSCPLQPLAGGAGSGLYQRARTALLEGNKAAIEQVQFQQAAPGGQVLVSPLTGQVQTLPPPPQELGPAPAWEPQSQDLRRPQLNGQEPPSSLPGESGSTAAASGPTRVDITARDSTVDFNIKILSFLFGF